MWIYLGLFLIGGAAVTIPVLGGCPEVKIMENFDLTKYVGKWYEAERYVASFDSDWKCASQTYTNNKNRQLSVDYKQISASNDLVISTSGTVKQDNANIAKLTNTIQIITTDSIVDTDYKSYAVVSSCIGGAQQPEAAVLEKAYQALDKNKIKRTSFKPTDQKTCPK